MGPRQKVGFIQEFCEGNPMRGKLTVGKKQLAIDGSDF